MYRMETVLHALVEESEQQFCYTCTEKWRMRRGGRKRGGEQRPWYFFEGKSTLAVMGGQGNCCGIDLVMFTKDMSIFHLK